MRSGGKRRRHCHAVAMAGLACCLITGAGLPVHARQGRPGPSADEVAEARSRAVERSKQARAAADRLASARKGAAELAARVRRLTEIHDGELAEAARARMLAEQAGERVREAEAELERAGFPDRYGALASAALPSRLAFPVLSPAGPPQPPAGSPRHLFPPVPAGLSPRPALPGTNPPPPAGLSGADPSSWQPSSGAALSPQPLSSGAGPSSRSVPSGADLLMRSLPAGGGLPAPSAVPPAGDFPAGFTVPSLQEALAYGAGGAPSPGERLDGLRRARDFFLALGARAEDARVRHQAAASRAAAERAAAEADAAARLAEVRRITAERSLLRDRASAARSAAARLAGQRRAARGRTGRAGHAPTGRTGTVRHAAHGGAAGAGRAMRGRTGGVGPVGPLGFVRGGSAGPWAYGGIRLVRRAVLGRTGGPAGWAGAARWTRRPAGALRTGRPAGARVGGGRFAEGRVIGAGAAGDRLAGGRMIGQRAAGGRVVGSRVVGERVAGARVIGGRTLRGRSGGDPWGRGAGGGWPEPDWWLDPAPWQMPGDVVADWALTQLDKPYVWAASGPRGYDCSGLAMRAWERAGVRLDHWTGSQWTSGRHIRLDRLHRGDLLFFGRLTGNPADVRHVGIYIGGGLMVHAPQTGDVVRIAPMWRGDLVGATRPA
ncbi:NlpC/P60 family protein [Streptosporangium sandarakinum]|uniref:NlpC/P60 family protein n=1 Tax=Streptosporangium sandarakinum TaxID=1260955 RepID=UPI0034141A5E